MGRKTGIGYRALQFFLRFVQFCCAVTILGIFSYFLSVLHNHRLYISPWERAVEALSGLAVIWTFLAMLFLCCLPGHPIVAIITTILDVCFFGAFIYIAVKNRGSGRGSCYSRIVRDTILGSGPANQKPIARGGFTSLPTYRDACQLQKAVYALAIIALLFFIFSVIAEWLLVRNRRQEKRAEHQRYADGGGHHAYGHGHNDGDGRHHGGGGGGRFGNRFGGGGNRRNDAEAGHALRGPGPDGNNNNRASYATGDTAIGSDPGMVHAKPGHMPGSAGHGGSAGHMPGGRRY
ncbi:hypothetical protein GGR56DRAFT_676386 [Xylariaceae sp. FL0804]|nr:hypothetical protein GGR56DRAFT_676386 [Xylariaceae sp. FL0804]